jgi:hypothetical protein
VQQRPPTCITALLGHCVAAATSERRNTAVPRRFHTRHSWCERCLRLQRTAALVSAALLAVRRQYQVRPLDAGQRAPAAAAEATDKNVRYRAASKFQRISSSDRVSQVRHNVSNTAHQVPRRMLQDAALETATARASPNSAHACNAPAGRTATLVKLQLTGRAHTRRMRRAAQVAPRAERQRGRREARCDFSRASMPGERHNDVIRAPADRPERRCNKTSL